MPAAARQNMNIAGTTALCHRALSARPRLMASMHAAVCQRRSPLRSLDQLTTTMTARPTQYGTALRRVTRRLEAPEMPLRSVGSQKVNPYTLVTTQKNEKH